MNEVEIMVSRPVNKEILNDIFITALEGGSNSWYYFHDKACETLDKYKVRKVEENEYARCFSERLLPAIMAGETLLVHDIEEPEGDSIGYLSLEHVKDGIEKMIIDGRKEVNILFCNDIDDADYDACDADVLFQYFVMGELVYG